MNTAQLPSITTLTNPLYIAGTDSIIIYILVPLSLMVPNHHAMTRKLLSPNWVVMTATAVSHSTMARSLTTTALVLASTASSAAPEDSASSSGEEACSSSSPSSSLAHNLLIHNVRNCKAGTLVLAVRFAASVYAGEARQTKPNQTNHSLSHTHTLHVFDFWLAQSHPHCSWERPPLGCTRRWCNIQPRTSPVPRLYACSCWHSKYPFNRKFRNLFYNRPTIKYPLLFWKNWSKPDWPPCCFGLLTMQPVERRRSRHGHHIRHWCWRQHLLPCTRSKAY